MDKLRQATDALPLWQPYGHTHATCARLEDQPVTVLLGFETWDSNACEAMTETKSYNLDEFFSTSWVNSLYVG